MGTIHHQVILATTYEQEHADAVKAWIAGRTEHEQQLFASRESWANGDTTFVMTPDGSKEGWRKSDKGNELRKQFIEALLLYDSFHVLEVHYGDNESGLREISR